jgi:hypothetical protein
MIAKLPKLPKHEFDMFEEISVQEESGSQMKPNTTYFSYNPIHDVYFSRKSNRC